MAQTTESTTQNQLPLRALLAFASRCARRVQQHYRLPEGEDEAVIHLAAIENAIRLTERFAAGEDIGSEMTADAEEQAIAALVFVKQHRPDDDRSAYAANTAYAAINATRGAIEVEQSGGDESLAQSVWDSVQIVGDAARLADDTVERAALFDLEMLTCLRLGRFPALGDPIDPSEKGLLGPLQRRAKRRRTGGDNSHHDDVSDGSSTDAAGSSTTHPTPTPVTTAVEDVDTPKSPRSGRSRERARKLKRYARKLAARKQRLAEQQSQLEEQRLQLEQEKAAFKMAAARSDREPSAESDSVFDEEDAREREWMRDKETLEKQAFILQQELDAAKAAFANGQAEWSSERETFESLLAESERSPVDTEELQQLREQNERQEQEDAIKAERIRHLEQQLKSEQELASHHWEQAEKVREELEEFREEVERERRPLEEEREALAAAREELERREAELQAAEAQAAERQQELERTGVALTEQREQLQQEAAALHDRAATVQKDRAENVRRTKSLDARAEKMKERGEVLKHRNAVLKKRQRKITAEKEEFQSTLDGLDRRTKELAAKEEQLRLLEAELENDRKALQLARSEIKTDRENLQQAVNEFAERKEHDEDVAQELESLRAQLQSEKESLWETAAAMQARRDRLEADFTDLSVRNSELLEEQARLEMRISQLREIPDANGAPTGSAEPLLTRGGGADRAPVRLLVRPGLAGSDELRDLFNTLLRLYHGLSGWSLKLRVRDCRLCPLTETIEWSELTEVERGVADVELTPFGGDDASTAGKFDVHRWVQFRSCLLMVLRLDGDTTQAFVNTGTSHPEHEAAQVVIEALNQVQLLDAFAPDAMAIDRMNEELARADVMIQQLRRRCRARFELATPAVLSGKPRPASPAPPAATAPPSKPRKSKKWGW